MKNATSRLHSVWQDRFDGRIAAAREGLRAFLREQTELSPELESEVALLNASFARSEGQSAESWRFIEEGRELLRSANLNSSFHLSLQTAINLMVDSRFVEALQCLREAIKENGDHFFRLVAKYNMAVCHHNLGLSTVSLVAEIKSEIATEKDHSLRSGLLALQMMDVEQAICRGDFSGIFQHAFPLTSQGAAQQALWASIPWLSRGTEKFREEYLQLLNGDDEFFQKGYVLQTLVADPRFRSLEKGDVNLQLTVDRLYLWTWKWLEKPDSALASILAEEWSRFPWETASLSLATSDFYLLRSAGSWLGAFDADFNRAFEGWLKKSWPAQIPASPFFDFDLEVSRSLRGEAVAWDALLQSERARGVVPSAYLQFVRGLRPAPVPVDPRRLIVDVQQKKLSFGQATLISESGVGLLQALRKDGSISFEEALSAAFGLHGFDEFVHGPKIHNLLQRIKKLLSPGVSLRTKGQRIYLEMSGDLFFVHESPAHCRSFPKIEMSGLRAEKKQVQRLKAQTQIVGRVKLQELFEKKKFYTRLELQNLLGLPKATMNRRLGEWVNSRVLEKSGDGRLSAYSLAGFDSPTSSHKNLSGRKSRTP